MEKFIISKYQDQLFKNKNIDILTEKLGWDRETILAYFTKVLAQKRYTQMQAVSTGKKVKTNPIEEFRKNPEKYISMIDFDINDDEKPDLSIMQDNQIIDVIVDKATRDI